MSEEGSSSWVKYVVIAIIVLIAIVLVLGLFGIIDLSQLGGGGGGAGYVGGQEQKGGGWGFIVIPIVIIGIFSGVGYWWHKKKKAAEQAEEDVVLTLSKKELTFTNTNLQETLVFSAKNGTDKLITNCSIETEPDIEGFCEIVSPKEGTIRGIRSKETLRGNLILKSKRPAGEFKEGTSIDTNVFLIFMLGKKKLKSKPAVLTINWEGEEERKKREEATKAAEEKEKEVEKKKDEVEDLKKQLEDANKKLEAAKKELEKATEEGMTKEDAEAFQKLLDELRDKKRKAESDLGIAQGELAKAQAAAAKAKKDAQKAEEERKRIDDLLGKTKEELEKEKKKAEESAKTAKKTEDDLRQKLATAKENEAKAKAAAEEAAKRAEEANKKVEEIGKKLEEEKALQQPNKDKIKKLEEEKKKLEDGLAEEKRKSNDTWEQAEDAAKRAKEQEEAAEKAEDAKKAAEEREKQVEKALYDAERRATQLEQKRATAEQIAEDLGKQLAAVKKQVGETETKKKEAEEKIEKLNDLLKAAKKEWDKTLGTLNKTKGELEKAQKELDNAIKTRVPKAELETAKTKLKEAENAVKEQEGKAKKAEAEVRELEEKLEKAKALFSDAVNEIREWKKEVERIENDANAKRIAAEEEAATITIKGVVYSIKEGGLGLYPVKGAIIKPFKVSGTERPLKQAISNENGMFETKIKKAEIEGNCVELELTAEKDGYITMHPLKGEPKESVKEAALKKHGRETGIYECGKTYYIEFVLPEEKKAIILPSTLAKMLPAAGKTAFIPIEQFPWPDKEKKEVLLLPEPQLSLAKAKDAIAAQLSLAKYGAYLFATPLKDSWKFYVENAKQWKSGIALVPEIKEPYLAGEIDKLRKKGSPLAYVRLPRDTIDAKELQGRIKKLEKEIEEVLKEKTESKCILWMFNVSEIIGIGDREKEEENRTKLNEFYFNLVKKIIATIMEKKNHMLIVMPVEKDLIGRLKKDEFQWTKIITP